VALAFYSGTTAGAAGPLSPVRPLNSIAQPLPFFQDWQNRDLITTNDDWSGVPGVEGYFLRNDGVATTGVDPRTILGDTFGAGTTTVELDVLANQPPTATTNTAGGIMELHPDSQGNPFFYPTVALQPDDTVDAPFLIINLNTTGESGINIRYSVNDLDCTSDDAVQMVATQFRVGNTGNFTNLPNEFVTDNTQGPDLCTQITIMGGDLPEEVNDKPLVQIRIITTNAAGADEWVGIDFIEITAGTATPTNTPTATPTYTPTRTPTATPTATPFQGPAFVLSQVDGGGGGSTGTYLYDYIEIKNITALPRSLNGLSLYYGSALGNFASSPSDAFALPNVNLNPGQYFLVQLGTPGTAGAPLPVTPDATTAGLNMSGTDGKVALVTDRLTINECGATATPCSPTQLSFIVDWVAYGAAGNGTAGNGEGGTSVNNGVALTPTQGAVRKNGGCTDTNNNDPDFDVVTDPVPRNTQTTIPCGTTQGRRSRADFDGDGRSDFSVFRPSEGNWYLQRSTSGFTGINFGLSDDIPTPGDFDGDGTTDIAVFRPSNGFWYGINSGDNSSFVVNFGLSGDVPQAGDFDGDGRDDIAVFRPSNGTWYWQRSSDGGFMGIQFGQNGDLPVAGDYDSDGKDDVSVFRQGIWYRINSTDGSAFAYPFGFGTDLPVPADYDGDDFQDIAVFRPSNGNWYWINSSSGQPSGVNWGQSGDIPVPGDYDGDARDDVAVYRDGTWFVNQSTVGPLAYPFGLNSDIPIPKKYIP